jgi:hypothetical protein
MLHNSLLRGKFFKNREFDVSLLLICSSGLMMLLALIAIFRSVSDFAAFCEWGVRKVAFFLEVNSSVEKRFLLFSVSPFDRMEKIQ